MTNPSRPRAVALRDVSLLPRFEAPEELDFGETLRHLMARPTYAFTPGWLSKVSGIPKATIVNWLEGRVRCPRGDGALRRLCDAMRLNAAETTLLYQAAGVKEPVRHDGLAAFDRIPVGLYRTTPEGRILYANSTLIEILGYRNLREYQALDVAEDLYVSPSQRAAWMAQIALAGSLRRYLVRAKKADGSAISFLDSATAILDPQGRILYFEGIWEPAPGPHSDTN